MSIMYCEQYFILVKICSRFVRKFGPTVWSHSDVSNAVQKHLTLSLEYEVNENKVKTDKPVY